MTRIPAYALTLATLAVFLLTFSACPRSKERATRAAAEERDATLGLRHCPDGMAYVKKARICMDIYEYPNAFGEVPLGGVKWEDAERLCREQGKRLPTAKEWEAACKGKEEHIYPYGKEYKVGVCIVDLMPGDGAAPSGAVPDCRTAEGIYDLSGNMWEWTSTPGFEKGTYYVKGGSWSSYPSVATCEFKAWEPPEAGGPDYGFRCVTTPSHF